MFCRLRCTPVTRRCAAPACGQRRFVGRYRKARLHRCRLLGWEASLVVHAARATRATHGFVQAQSLHPRPRNRKLLISTCALRERRSCACGMVSRAILRYFARAGVYAARVPKEERLATRSICVANGLLQNAAGCRYQKKQKSRMVMERTARHATARSSYTKRFK